MPATLPLPLPARSIPSARVPPPAERPGLLARLIGVLPRQHGFEDDRELAHRLSFADVKLTDELERRISDYALRNAGFGR